MENHFTSQLFLDTFYHSLLCFNQFSVRILQGRSLLVKFPGRRGRSMGIGLKWRSVLYNKISLYISSTAVFLLIVWVRVHPFFLVCKKNIKWYHHLFFSSRELPMALPTFYRLRCLRKEPHDERLVVVVNCAVWMVLWDFMVFINMRIIWSNQSSCNLTPFTADLKFFAPQQITLSHMTIV